jgi:hypothetical protein
VTNVVVFWDPVFFYDDSFVALKRPPVPVFLHVRTGGGVGNDCGCCDCNCTIDCTSCFAAFTRCFDRFLDMLSPIGAAHRSYSRFRRSLYFGFTNVKCCHASRTLGPMCS